MSSLNSSVGFVSASLLASTSPQKRSALPPLSPVLHAAIRMAAIAVERVALDAAADGRELRAKDIVRIVARW